MKRKAQNLDDMLAVVRENPPSRGLFSSDDIQTMIGQDRGESPTQQKVAGEHQSPFILYRNRIIMISITSLLVSGGILLYLGQSAPTTQIIPSPGQPTLREHIAPSPRAPLPVVHTHPQLAERNKDKGKALPETAHPAGEKKEFTDTLRIAGTLLSDLKPSDLERIFGIRFTETQVLIPGEQSIETRQLSIQQMKMFGKYGYDTSAAEIYIQQQTAVDLPPILRGVSDYTGPRNSRLIASPLSLVLLDESAPTDQLIVTFANETQLERIGGTDEQFMREINALKGNNRVIEPGSLLSRLAAIHINLPYTKEGKECHKDLYIWYAPTPQLVETLPTQYRTKQIQALSTATYPIARKPLQESKPLIPGILQSTTRTTAANDTTPSYSKDLIRLDGNADISGIRFLDLTESELERLGVRHTDSGLNFTMQQQFRITDPNTTAKLEELGYDVSKALTNVGFRVTTDTFDMDYKEIPNKEFNPSALSPVLYSCRWTKPAGKEGLWLIFNTESPLLEKLNGKAEELHTEVSDAFNSQNEEASPAYHVLNKLIPIRIRLESRDFIKGAGKYRGSEILLWYVPTPEFVNALPDRYRISLEKELDIIASVEEGNLPPGEVCRQMAGDAVMLDFCRSGSGAIASTQVWPNPARENAVIRYTLTAPRQVAITLHDLSGKYLKELVKYEDQTQGGHEQNIDLDGIGTGTYLITVRTDKGEQGVQRIIVQ